MLESHPEEKTNPACTIPVNWTKMTSAHLRGSNALTFDKQPQHNLIRGYDIFQFFDKLRHKKLISACPKKVISLWQSQDHCRITFPPPPPLPALLRSCSLQQSLQLLIQNKQVHFSGRTKSPSSPPGRELCTCGIP